MTVWHFVDNFFPEVSGIADSVLTTAKQLVLLGYSVKLFGPRYSTHDYVYIGKEPNRMREEEVGGVSVTRLPSLPFPTGTNQGRVVLPLPALRAGASNQRPRLVHVHFPAGAGLTGLLLAKRWGIPVIGTIHTPLEEFYQYLPAFRRTTGRAATRWHTAFYNSCTMVTSPSQTLLAHTRTQGLRVPTSVVSNPIDCDLFSPSASKDVLKSQLGLPSFVMVYAGRLAMEKGLLWALEALALLKERLFDATFLIIGRGREEDRLKQIAEGYRLGRLVRFLGYVKGTEALADYFKASDVFISTSTAESQGMAMCQAMACGVPAIAVGSWGASEYVPQGIGHLLRPGDVCGLADCIWGLYSQRTLFAEAVRTLPPLVRSYSIPVITRRWIDIYQEVAGDRWADGGVLPVRGAIANSGRITD